MHPLVGDLRRGVRQWWKSRGLAALALVALALGIGATTAIFSVVNAVLPQPLPFRDADRLLAIFEKNIPQRKSDLYAAGINIDEWRQRSLTVSGVAAIFDGKMILTGGPGGRMEAEELKSERVSANLFPLLGVHPVLGRGFLASEDVPGQSNVAVLSYELWQRRFGADPSIPGKSIRLRGSSYTVVGVLPAGFSLIEPGVDVWTPLNFDINDPRVASGRSLTAIARLRRGVTFEQAVSEFDSMGASLEAAYPAIDSGYRAVVRPLAEQIVGKTRQAIGLLPHRTPGVPGAQCGGENSRLYYRRPGCLRARSTRRLAERFGQLCHPCVAWRLGLQVSVDPVEHCCVPCGAGSPGTCGRR